MLTRILMDYSDDAGFRAFLEIDDKSRYTIFRSKQGGPSNTCRMAARCLREAAKGFDMLSLSVDPMRKETQSAVNAQMHGSTFDLVSHIHRQMVFSNKTFGPGPLTERLCDHITKELAEIRDNPTDLMEWVDVIMLALDGAWRAGYSPEQIATALDNKLTINERRKWPDWRTAEPEKAIEHVRDAAEPSKTCQWHEDEEYSWSSACGAKWHFDDEESPSGQGMVFCPSCSLKIVEVEFERTEEGDPA